MAIGFGAIAPGNARASDGAKGALVEVSLLSPLFGAYNGYFFFRVAPSVALGVVAGYSSVTDENAVSSTGWSVGLEANWFLTGSAIASGWRIVPSVRFLSTQYTHGSGSASDPHFDLGLEGGYRWVWGNGLTLGLSAGLGFQTHGKEITLSDGYTLVFNDFLQISSGLAPLANISFGYAF